MHTDPSSTFARLDRVMRERFVPRINETLAGVVVEAWHVDGGQGEPVSAAHALGLSADAGRQAPEYLPFAIGDLWSAAWGTTWFRIRGSVAEIRSDHALEVVIDLGWADHSVGFQSEALVYAPGGRIIKALNPKNRWVPLAGLVDSNGEFTFYLEAAANPLMLEVIPFNPTQMGEKSTAGAEPVYSLGRADVTAFHSEIFELVRDLEVVGGLARHSPVDQPRYWRLVRALDLALDAADPQNLDETAPAARAALAGVLNAPAHATAHKLTAVGHAHIDSAWLWPLRETVRKVARTVSNVLNLMDEDPTLNYAMSSAQQFAWLEEFYPQLFDRVQQRVREGRFHPVGGMWVESDTNMPSGEAMVRQFTFGQRYFLERFGAYAEEVWLPDSFGYSASLPQIVNQAGFTSFLTQKISWNDTNKFPHHSFQWEGLDGSRIFTHFPPADTYGAELVAKELAHAVENFADKSVSSHSLIPFGYGDGGGGPTREMLARAERWRNLEGAPTVSIRSPREFFDDAKQEFADAGGASVWVGELYLELHRGTFTSQLGTKQGNRRLEGLLRAAEYLAVQASLHGADYPHEEFDAIWKTVLLHQFHDILPGSSIAWVHREARETYAALAARVEVLMADSAAEIRAARPDGSLIAGVLSPLQRAGVAAWSVAEVPSAEAVELVQRTDGGFTLDNGVLTAIVAANGLVSSIVDHETGRQLVPAGEQLGRLQLHRDEPVLWDAWDIDRGARRTVTELAASAGIAAFDDGAVRGVRVAYAFGDSEATLSISLSPGGRQLDMHLDIDWHERERLLKVALPLDVYADAARYETQFGSVARTIHENTSWDIAHYEVCAHRYVHIAEPGFGVAVVNDSSYGHEVSKLGGRSGGVMVQLSLLRAPLYPDPETDQGRHEMRWAVVPAPSVEQAIAAGHALSAPAVPALPEGEAFVAVLEQSGVIVVDTVKAADDRSGDVVVRLYEAQGGRASGVLRLDALFGPGARVVEVDLLEREIAPDAVDTRSGGPLNISLRPFQLVSLRIRPAS